ncbi:MAG: MarR family winged helix-turn-helix transcriptional regulator [Lachnospiraceae bacterium]
MTTPYNSSDMGEDVSASHKCVWKYMEIVRLHRTVLEHRFSKTGVYRSQHQILMYVSDHPNASQKEIAERYKISTAAIAVSLKKLEKGGYIRREVDEKDNRYNQIDLTEKGRQIVDISQSIFGQVEEEMFDGFSGEDFEKLMEYLERVRKNLERIVK